MELLRKHISLQVKATNDETRSIEGYAATYNNVDGQGDMILPGAFTASLAKRMPKMLCQHDTDCVIGMWRQFADDGTGLKCQGDIAPTEDGNDTYTLLKMGALDSLSIGYTVVDAELTTIAGNTVRVLKQLDLWEVSIVTFPANEQAKITGVKNTDGTLMTERQFEEFLRDVGSLSQKEAKCVLSEGYRALLKQKHRDGVPDEKLNSITSLLNQFKP
jgi:HK97 family phage prohead protease